MYSQLHILAELFMVSR